jgi:hypothetical protein
MNDDELENLLRPAPIDDDGFTAQVVQRLPPAKKRAPRFAILLGATTLASVTGLAIAPHAFTSLIQGVQAANSAAPWIVLASVVAVLVGAATQEAVRATS